VRDWRSKLVIQIRGVSRYYLVAGVMTRLGSWQVTCMRLLLINIWCW